MKLDSSRLDCAVPTRQNLDWSSEFAIHTKQPKQQYCQAGNWVKLLELPNPYSFDEALLLCSISEDEWVAWIPDHGEAVLHTRHFCKIS